MSAGNNKNHVNLIDFKTIDTGGDDQWSITRRQRNKLRLIDGNN